MDSKRSDRRRFLKEGAMLAGLAVGGGAIRSASGQSLQSGTKSKSETQLEGKDFDFLYGLRSPFETSGRAPTPGLKHEQSSASYTPLQDTTGIITPAALHFYTIRFRTTPPKIDPREHRLLIHGMVNRPLILTLEDLKLLPSVSRIHFVECAGNSSPAEFEHNKAMTVQTTHGWTACSEWTGVQLSLLLKEAGVQKGGNWLVAEGADVGRHAKSIPMEKAMDDCIVCYGQNGEAVRPEQGYPMRLVVPGWEGVQNIKWLRRIKVVDQPNLTKDDLVYSQVRPDGKSRWFQFELGPKSVITFPSGEQRLPKHGLYEITGLAWSGGGAVRRVEVSTDGGRTWKDAELQNPVFRIAHTRFRFPWKWDGEEAVLQSRCTDERGGVQPTVAELAKLWGVTPDFFTAANHVNHFNPIQPWKVTSEGSVHNALSFS